MGSTGSGNQDGSFYSFGQYLFYEQAIRKLRLVITRTNGEDVDTNASLALTSLGGGGLVNDTADAITNVLPYQDWNGLRLGTPDRSFTAYIQREINSLTATTKWEAVNATSYGVDLKYTGDGANWGNSVSATGGTVTSVGSSTSLGSVGPSNKQIVLLFTATYGGTVETAYKFYTQGDTQILTTADGSNTDKTSVFTLDSLPSFNINSTTQGTGITQEVKEFVVKNMPGSSGSNITGYTFNYSTNIYESGTNDIIEKTVESQFSTGQNFADEDNYDYSDFDGFDSSVANSLNSNLELATQLRSMLAGNPTLSSLAFGAVTDSGVDDDVGSGSPDIQYFTITGEANGTPFNINPNVSSERKVRKFTNNNIDNTGNFQIILKDIDFGQPGLSKNVYKIYIRWRVKDHANDMSKTYVKAFYGVDGEDLAQTGYGRTFSATKSKNYDADGLVWHEDLTDIKSTTISDALLNTPIAGFNVASCDTSIADTTVDFGAAYAVGFTGSMTVKTTDVTTKVGVGYVITTATGATIGTVTTVTDSTHITCSDGIEVAVSNNDPIYIKKTITLDSGTTVAVPQSVFGAGIPADTYVASVSSATVNTATVHFFTVNNAVTATNTNTTLNFKSDRVTVASINDINRGDAGMIDSERMLLNPFNEQNKILKLTRPHQSSVAAHTSGSTLYIFPKTKSYISELIPTDNIRNITSFQLKLENGAGVPAHFEIEDISIIYRIKGVR